jgi:hypothetical protein
MVYKVSDVQQIEIDTTEVEMAIADRYFKYSKTCSK